MQNHLTTPIATLFFCLLLASCATLDSSKNWSADIPDRSIFINYYLEDTNPNASNNEIERHLTWIKRFYFGSILYPIGWNEMIDMLVNSLESKQDKTTARQKLNELGLKISLEWSRKNDVRNIDSSNIATWGTALRTSVEEKEQLYFIDKVEQDIEHLLAGRLSKEQITRQRYYPPEDYDNF